MISDFKYMYSRTSHLSGDIKRCKRLTVWLLLQRKSISPGVLNPRAADRYRSVAQSVPGRTIMNQLFLLYLLFKSWTIIKGDSLLHLQLVGEEENIKYKCKLQKIINCARQLLCKVVGSRTTIRRPSPRPPPSLDTFKADPGYSVAKLPSVVRFAV